MPKSNVTINKYVIQYILDEVNKYLINLIVCKLMVKTGDFRLLKRPQTPQNSSNIC